MQAPELGGVELVEYAGPAIPSQLKIVIEAQEQCVGACGSIRKMWRTKGRPLGHTEGWVIERDSCGDWSCDCAIPTAPPPMQDSVRSRVGLRQAAMTEPSVVVTEIDEALRLETGPIRAGELGRPYGVDIWIEMPMRGRPQPRSSRRYGCHVGWLAHHALEDADERETVGWSCGVPRAVDANDAIDGLAQSVAGARRDGDTSRHTSPAGAATSIWRRSLLGFGELASMRSDPAVESAGNAGRRGGWPRRPHPSGKGFGRRRLDRPR